jgi:hypothetical protein
MGHVGVSIFMAFTEVENVMAALIGELAIAEEALEVLMMLLHGLVSQLGLQSFFGHIGNVVCVTGD